MAATTQKGDSIRDRGRCQRGEGEKGNSEVGVQVVHAHRALDLGRGSAPRMQCLLRHGEPHNNDCGVEHTEAPAEGGKSDIYPGATGAEAE